MRWRPLTYAATAAAIIGAVCLANRAGRRPPDVTIDVDPQAATQQGPHDHERLGTACLCDPEAEIKQALRDRADFSETHRELGDRFYARGQYEYALARYQRAVELDALNAPAHYGMGIVYTKLGQFDRATQSIKEASEIDPAMVDAQVSLGILAYRAGEFDQARKRWETALRLDQENGYIRELLQRLPRLRKFGGH